MLRHGGRHVRETLLTATRADSTLYALIAFTDGGLGIARDGVPLGAFYWSTTDDIDECVGTFMRLAGLESCYPCEALNHN